MGFHRLLTNFQLNRDVYLRLPQRNGRYYHAISLRQMKWLQFLHKLYFKGEKCGQILFDLSRTSRWCFWTILHTRRVHLNFYFVFKLKIQVKRSIDSHLIPTTKNWPNWKKTFRSPARGLKLKFSLKKLSFCHEFFGIFKKKVLMVLVMSKLTQQ